MWFIKKKSSEHTLTELVEGLTKAFGPKLLSVLLFGSRASGEAHEDRSDVNVFLVLSDMSMETLELMSAPLKRWVKAGHAMPIFIQKSELQIYADSLPIEFLDMQDHHKVILGTDPLHTLKVDRSNLRAQCLQELSIKLLKLRQAVLLARGFPERLRILLKESMPSVLTLYRAALRLESEVSAGHKILAAKELAKRAGVDDDCLVRLSEVHMRRDTDNLEDLTRQYLNSLERVVAYLNRK